MVVVCRCGLSGSLRGLERCAGRLLCIYRGKGSTGVIQVDFGGILFFF